YLQHHLCLHIFSRAIIPANFNSYIRSGHKMISSNLRSYSPALDMPGGIKSSEIRLPITEKDRQEFRKIIADQEKMTDIVMEDYRFLQHHGHNGKGGDWIHIGWLLGCTVADTEKVLISPPERQAERDLSKKVLAHIQKRFEGVPLAPVLIR
ncbi:hypothetical protein RclHR1_28660001, partial [Rhizophagus clarus]